MYNLPYVFFLTGLTSIHIEILRNRFVKALKSKLHGSDITTKTFNVKRRHTEGDERNVLFKRRTQIK